MNHQKCKLTFLITLLLATPSICTLERWPYNDYNSTAQLEADYVCSPDYEQSRQRDCGTLCFNVICLPTMPTPPDPLGILLVSGFYGPGSWSGWILALLASCVRLYTKPFAKLDPNTWLFLMGTNWASVDFLRHVRDNSPLERNSTERDKRAGAIAASLSVTYWGCGYTLMQLLTVLMIQKAASRPLTQRLVTLLCGSLLPSISLTVALFSMKVSDQSVLLGGVAANNLPFLYNRGSFPPVFYIFSAIALGLCMLLYVVAALTSVFTRFVLYDWFSWARTWSASWEVETTLLLLLAPWLPLMVCVFGIMANAMKYLPTGFRAVWSESCFHMPCAPQSLLDWDQLYSLVVGLLLLFGIEIAPTIIRRRKEKRDFENNLRERIDKGLNKRRARALVRKRGDLSESTNIAMESDDVELGILNADKDDEEPDATLDFDTLDRAILHEAFAASEHDTDFSGFVNEASDGIGTAVGEDEAFDDELYMMSGALMTDDPA